MNRTPLGHKLSARPDRGDVNDHIYVPPAGFKAPDASALPASWILRIEDQGQEGSCTAHAGTYYREALELKYSPRRKPIQLSRAFLYAMERMLENGNLNDDTGAEMRTIPKVLNQYGVCAESSMRYSDTVWTRKPSNTAMRLAKKYSIAEYMRVVNGEDFVTVIAAEQVGVLMGISWYDSYDTPDASRTGFLTPPSKRSRVRGGHALYVDSYDLTGKKFGVPVVSGPNSWGAGWGDGGRFYYPLSSVENTDMTSDNWMIRK